MDRLFECHSCSAARRVCRHSRARADRYPRRDYAAHCHAGTHRDRDRDLRAIRHFAAETHGPIDQHTATNGHPYT